MSYPRNPRALEDTIVSASPESPVANEVGQRRGRDDERHLEPVRVTPRLGNAIPAAADGSADSGAHTLTAPEISSFDQRYVPGPLLGRGGMGEVYLCRDMLLGREVAMKIIATANERERANLQRRFVREMRVQGQLEHPAVVPVYDAGLTRDGARFFTMKCVRGESLKDVLARHGANRGKRPRADRRLLDSFRSLCLAVHYAHEKGVVHRDLKPSNVMLGGFGEVYVLDWGLAKLLDAPTESESQAHAWTPALADDPPSDTRRRGTLGTPGYMAPEQITRESAIDQRADIYALGAILFYILTGEPLHSQPAAAERMASTLNLQAAAPLERQRAAETAPELADLCARATQRTPALRLSSAAELANAVEAFLDGDRDHERRRAQAQVHAHSAAEALTLAGHDSADELAQRSVALREVGRALVLDADNEGAMATLGRLLRTTPTTMPAEAQRSIDERKRASLVKRARAGMFFYASLPACVPLMLWMGVRDQGMFWVGWSLLAVLFGLNAYCVRIYRGNRMPAVRVLVGTSVLALSSVMFGVFVIVPMCLVAQSYLYITDDGPRFGLIGLSAALCVAIPLGLQWTGLTPAQYVFDADGWHILPTMFHVHPVATPLFLFIGVMVIVLGAAAMAASMQRDRELAERRLALHSWQLRQVLPRLDEEGCDTSAFDFGGPRHPRS